MIRSLIGQADKGRARPSGTGSTRFAPGASFAVSALRVTIRRAGDLLACLTLLAALWGALVVTP